MLTARRINITECKPVWLSETNQGFHVHGHIAHHGMLPVPFAFAADECGTPLLRNWFPAGTSIDDRKAILDAVEQVM